MATYKREGGLRDSIPSGSERMRDENERINNSGNLWRWGEIFFPPPVLARILIDVTIKGVHGMG